MAITDATVDYCGIMLFMSDTGHEEFVSIVPPDDVDDPNEGWYWEIKAEMTG